MKFIKYNSNICDRTYNELMLQLTKACPNSCSFCIDKLNHGVYGRPDFEAIKVYDHAYIEAEATAHGKTYTPVAESTVTVE